MILEDGHFVITHSHYHAKLRSEIIKFTKVETNFEISLTTAVFTTWYVLDNTSPILHVFHFEDGNWQFCGAERTLFDEDYRLVSLGEILVIDPSLRMLGNLKVGFEAIRSSRQNSWRIIPSN